MPTRSDLCGLDQKRLVLSEDRAFEVTESVARIEPELVEEGASRPLVCVERIDLASGSIESEHQLPVKALAQRMLANELFELRHEIPMPAHGQLGLDPVFDHVRP